METVIDLGAEALVDMSRVADPYMRLLLEANGNALSSGSAWLVLDKRIAVTFGIRARIARTSSDAPHFPARADRRQVVTGLHAQFIDGIGTVEETDLI